MSRQIAERRIPRIEKQIAFLKGQIRKEGRKNTTFFLLGLIMGLLMNVLFLLLGF